MPPSSLTLSTGPKRLALIAAVVRAPSTMASSRSDSVYGCRRIAPAAIRLPLRVGDGRAVERRERGEHGRLELGHRAARQQVEQVAAGRRGRQVAGFASARCRGGPAALTRCDTVSAGSRSTTNSAPWRASARSSADLEQALARAAALPTASAQSSNFACRSSRCQCACGTRTPARPREHLDLVRRAQHHADVPAAGASRARAPRTAPSTAPAAPRCPNAPLGPLPARR